MRHLIVYNQISLDGYFSGEKGDISWAKANQDAEWKQFVDRKARKGYTDRNELTLSSSASSSRLNARSRGGCDLI